MSVYFKKILIVLCIVVILLLCTWKELGYYTDSGVLQSLFQRIYDKTPQLERRSCNRSETVQFVNYNQTGTLFITTGSLSGFGRLGNQMFRYASLMGIALVQGRKLIVQPGSELEKTFKLHHVDNKGTPNNWTSISEGNALAYNTKLMNLSQENFKVNGYLQSYKYFASIDNEVRCEYTFQDSVAGSASLILQDIRAKFRDCVFVGVHIRRGDFTSERGKRAGYVAPEKSYFVKAFHLIKSRLPGKSITFLVASDDLRWCKENIVGNNIVTLPAASSAVHLAILASCDHVIISGGTYGWWGAYLSGGYGIYFTGYLAKNTILGNNFSPTDYYPEYWTGLGN